MQKKNHLILYITIGILIVGVLVYNLANYFAHKKLINFLEENQTDLPIESYEDLKVNVWKGYLHVNNIALKWDGSDSTQVSTIKSKSITIKGVSLIKLWKDKDVKINHIEILEPEIHLVKGMNTSKDTTTTSKKNQKAPKINIAEVKVINAAFSNHYNNGDVQTTFKIVDATFDNINVEDWNTPEKWYHDLDSYHLEIEQLYHKATKWEVLKIEKILLSDTSYEVQNLHFKTELGIKEYNAQLPHERDHYNVKLPQVTLSPAIMDMQDNKHRIMVSHIDFSSPTVEIYRDKLLPDDTSIKPLFSQLLRELKFNIQTEEIKINDAAITYTERVKGQNDGGSVQFSEFDVVITDAGNFKEVNKEKDLIINIETTFMRSSKLSADWRFNPQNTDDEFHFQAKILNLDANRANEFTEPNLFVKMEGKIEQVYLNIHGNRSVSETDFAISYHELKVDLLKQNGKKHRKLISAIANIFVRRDSDTEVRKLQEEKVQVERDKTKSIFNFLWKNTLEGLKATTLRV